MNTIREQMTNSQQTRLYDMFQVSLWFLQ